MRSAHKWQFAPRFRRHAFGWRSDTPIQRIKEALSEIKQVARKEPLLAAEGAVTLLEKLSPALAQVDKHALDVIVNNAGVLRDRMFLSLSEEDWDMVMRVHLRGHFCMAKVFGSYWRDQKKAGKDVDARIINTSSGAGLQGSVGQSNYSAAKGGIAALTLVQAAELARYGVTANALAEEKERCLASGMDSCLSKPVTLDVIKQTLSIYAARVRESRA